MDQRGWKLSGKYDGKYKWYNKTRKIQKSFIYNEDKKATVIHHLRDTEEQQKYNDEHYELWGFEIDEDGNEHFEYGKYVVFVTKEEHTEIHKCSEETKNKLKSSWTSDKRKALSIKLSGENNPNYGKHFSDTHKKRISDSNKGKQHYTEDQRERLRQASIKLWEDNDYRNNQLSNNPFFKVNYGENHPMYGKHHTDETKEKISVANSGENHPMYGKHLSDETKEKIRNANLGKKRSAETCQRISDSKKGVFAGEKNPFYGKTHSEAVRLQLSIAAKEQFKEIKLIYRAYKDNGGELMWNEFRKLYKDHPEEFEALL